MQKRFDAPLKLNYLLIDYENVQPKSLELLNGGAFKVLVFVGASQTKIPVEFAKAMQSMGNDGEYIQISANGSNALDFHIAFTLGELTASCPDAYFHIISKDTGFDPLIVHVRKKGIRITRSKAIAEIPMLRVSNAKFTSERIEAVVGNLIPRGSSRPRKVKTLRSSINAIFMKSLEPSELETLVSELRKLGHISIDKENVTYHFKNAP